MNCTTQTDKYISVVKKLVSLNPALYNNFDAAAKFIISSDLTPEEKKLALINFSNIYNKLSSLNPDFFVAGKALEVAKAVNLVDDTKKYLEFASGLYEVKTTSSVTDQAVRKKIADLAKLSLISPADLSNPDGPLSLLKTYFNTSVFPSLETRQSVLDEMVQEMVSVITNSPGDSGYKELLIEQVKDTALQLSKKSDYVDLAEYERLAELNTVIVTLTNGNRVEAINQRGGLFYIAPDGSFQKINDEDILSTKDAIVDNSAHPKANAAEHIFSEDAFFSGFTIKAVNYSEQFEILRALTNSKTPETQVKIRAVKISTVGEERVRRMHEAAENNPSVIGGLTKRQHETFENPKQKEILKSSGNATIITVGRPKASEQVIAFEGEINGMPFYLYGLDNLVAVSSDNTTETVDFSNVAHLALVQKMARKEYMEGIASVTDEDLMKLSAAQKNIEAFKKIVLEKTNIQEAESPSADITDLFFDYFSFSQKRPEETQTRLDLEIENDPRLHKNLVVATLDDSGKPLKTENRNIVFYFQKNFDRNLGIITYSQFDFLGKNEMIVHQTETGEIEYLTESQYTQKVLGVTDKLFSETFFAKEDAALLSSMTSPERKNLIRTNTFILRFDGNGQVSSYAIVKPNRPFSRIEYYVQFIDKLSRALSNSDPRVKAKAIKDFDKLQYTFEATNSAALGKAVLSLNFATSSNATGSVVQVEIRPSRFGDTQRYMSVINDDNKRQFNFSLPEDKLRDLANAFRGSNTLIAKIKEEYSSLASLDLSKEADLFEFYRSISEIAQRPEATQSVTDFVSKIEASIENFAKILKTNVVDKIAQRTQEMTEFNKLFQEDFPNPDYLVLQPESNDKLMPKIELSYFNTQGREQYKKSLKNLRIVTSGKKELRIVAKNFAGLDANISTVKPIIETEEEVRASNAVDTSVPPSIDIIDSEAFSLASGSVDVASQSDILREAEWLAENLPQIGLDLSSLKDVIDLAKIDGTVLGAFKNRVIYLNSMMTSKGIVYHEAFHGVFRLLLDDVQRQIVINEVVNNKRNASRFTEKALREFADARNISFNKDLIIALTAEEILAEGFQKYMLNKSKPKGFIQTLFDILKKLLKFFKDKDKEIDALYNRIGNGYYRTAVAKSNIYGENAVAFELVPGLVKYVKNDNGQVLKTTPDLPIAEQKQLVALAVGMLLKDDTSRSVDEKLNDVITELVDLFDINNLIRQNPAKSAAIIEKYGPMYSNFRFVLGARARSIDVFDINVSGIADLNSTKTPINIKQTDGSVIDNTNGSYSLEVLKRLILADYRAASSVEIEKEELDVDKSLIENELEGQQLSSANEDADIKDEIEEDTDFESSFGEQNRIDTYVGQVRRFLSTLRRDVKDAELGVTVPRMIDGQQLFPVLLKITAGIEPRHIIKSLNVAQKQMLQDGYEEAHLDLKAVYDEINARTRMESDGSPMLNKHFYNMLVEVMHGIELNYAMVEASIPTNKNKSEEDIDAEETLAEVTFTLKDKVIEEDTRVKRNQIVSGIITTHSAKAGTPEYKKAVVDLITAAKTIIADRKISLFSSEIPGGQELELEKMVDTVYNSFTTIGAKIPKSLVRLSLMAIDKVENGIANEITGESLDFYNVNEGFVKEGQYLEKDFFRELINVFGSAFVNGIPNGRFAELLDDSNVRNKSIARFSSILRKASNFIIKYDPTNLPSVVRNAEGKPIYRYAKPNPLVLVAQDIRRKGLEQTLAEDPYYSDDLKLDFVKSFFNDNAALGEYLRGENTEKAKKMKLFLDNFGVALFGGVVQKTKGAYLEGKTFKNIDERSLHILNVLSFLNRQTLSDGKGTSVQTFSRSFHQLEATNTNFLVSAYYTPFVSRDLVNSRGTDYQKRGFATYKDQGNYFKIVEDLEAVVKQEYNRIKKEWSRRNEVKQARESGTSTLIINAYNGKIDQFDNIDVESNDLRAYNFNKLSDFFEANEELNDILVEAAKNGLEFEEAPLDKTSFLSALNKYAEAEYNAYLEDLVRLKMIKRNVEEGKAGTKGFVYHTSSFMPANMKIDYRQESLSAIYPTVLGLDPSKQSIVVDAILFDNFFNFWSNAMHINDIFDGDIAMNVKSAQDYVKRQKKQAAAGTSMKEGDHKVAYVNTIKAFSHPKYQQYGLFFDKQSLEQDPTIPEDVKEIMLADFEKAMLGVKANNIDYGKMMAEVFDGQSYSTLMHQMDMHDSSGRLSSRAAELLIDAHFRPLTKQEVDELAKFKIVNNAKKTVTSARHQYHKQSEAYVNRLDVSAINFNLVEGDTLEQRKEKTYDILRQAYSNIYDLRSDRKDAQRVNDLDKVKDIDQQITNNIKTAHSFFVALPHRRMLHDLLNSMEYHQIDQLMDTTASKNATLLPINLSENNRDELGYYNLSLSSINVPNKYKFIQVETSGVKESAKVSVQRKLLTAANLRSMNKIMELEAAKRGEFVTKSEKEAAEMVVDVLAKYQDSLKMSTDARYKYFRNVFRKGENFDIAKVYNLIRENLTAQGASSSVVNLFALKDDQTPVFSPNLSVIRNTLEYYFFSQYSKHVTDEKAAGGKYFHESGAFYNVLVDSQNNVIPTEEVAKDPVKYSGTDYRTRSLSVSVEEKNGQKVYMAEVILPKPYFDNPQQEEFYMNELREMFAVRIPTEDKRSMIAFKVVDFIDSSKLNNVIVPQFVHTLAGSDFDIDSLFTQSFAFYKDARGLYNKYGKYDNYLNAEQGKFLEFINFMSSKSDFSELIKAEKQRMIDENDLVIERGGAVEQALRAYGFTQQEINLPFEEVELATKYNDAKENVKSLRKLKNETKQLYLESIQKTEENRYDKNAWKERQEVGAALASVKADKQEAEEQKYLYQRGLQVVNVALTLASQMNVLSNYGIPVTFEAFASNDKFQDIVVPVYQNDNLQASMDVISNEAVFKNLYINQKSSTKAFTDILDTFGISMDEITQKGNLYTISNVVSSKVENGMNKDGIGITASINKFLSLASQYGAKLSDENVIWKYNTSDGVKVYKNEFGEFNERDERVIELIGNILGMFADGAKDPIPAALQLNEVNAGVALAMIGIGLNPELALAFNFLPEVKKAALAVQQSNFAISENPSSQFLFFNNAIDTEIQNLLDANPAALQNLLNAKLISERNPRRLDVISENLILDFAAQKINIAAVRNASITANEIGFSVNSVFAEDKAVNMLTDAEQKLILLSLYKKQAIQTFDIRKATTLTNYFKKINPTFVTFDKVKANMDALKEGLLLFDKDSSERIFNDQVYAVLYAMSEDLDKQSSLLFLERTKFFRPITNAFKGLFVDQKNIANVITNYFAIKKLQSSMPDPMSFKSAYMQNIIALDNQNLKDVFTPEYWFTNTLAEELEVMKNKYPDNPFLKLLRAEQNQKNTAYVLVNGKKQLTGETYIKMLGKAKLKGAFAEEVQNGAYWLYNSSPEDRLFIKKLFYHELARTGLGYKSGTFRQFLPADLLVPLSDGVSEFTDFIKDSAGNSEKLVSYLKAYIGKSEEAADSAVYDVFDELFYHLAKTASEEEGNSKIKSAAVKFSLNPGNKEGNYVASIYKTLKSVPEDRNTKVGLAIDILSHVFQRDMIDTVASEKNPSVAIDPFILGESITVNLSVPKNIEEVTEKTMNDIGNKLGFRFDFTTGLYNFPVIHKFGNTTYILQGVDDQLSNNSLGKNVVDSITGTGVFATEGTVARYIAMPSQFVSDSLSSIGFSREANKKYAQYINKQKDIAPLNIVTPGGKPSIDLSDKKNC